MPAERYFVDAPLEGVVTLEGSEWRHLTHVMRAQPDDEVELVNGKGVLARARLLSLSKRSASLCILSICKPDPLLYTLTLAQAIPRFSRLEWILEKGTELGATAFWLFPGMGSEKAEFSSNQWARMHALLIAAMKQCGRLDLPTIRLLPPLEAWDVPVGTFLFGDTRPHSLPLLEVALSEHVLFCTGPEKGFHEVELARLRALGGVGARLHTHTLRVDTASIAALSLLSQRLEAGA